MVDVLARLRDRRAARLHKRLPTERTCDGCDLCCVALPIHELDKPAGKPCACLEGEPGTNCSVYARRPRVCREFLCMWRISDHWLPDWAKPSECGFLISFNRVDEWPFVLTVSPDPKRPDAWKTLHAQTVMTALAEHLNCMVAIGSGDALTHVVSPAGICRPATFDQIRAGRPGAPDFEFGPDHRPLIAKLPELHLTWSLPPP